MLYLAGGMGTLLGMARADGLDLFVDVAAPVAPSAPDRTDPAHMGPGNLVNT